MENPVVDWPHRHDFYSLVWFTRSSGINVIDFEEYEIKHDRLFFMQPKQVHNWSYSKESKGYILVFAKHFIKEIPLELMDIAFVDLKSDSIKLIKPLLENLIKESKLNDNLVEKSIISGINYLLLHLTRTASDLEHNRKTKSKTILQFSKLVADTISKNLTVKDYADQLHITVEKLNEHCKENYGQNPKNIILEKKITEAKRLLYFTDLSIKEIAFRLGFEDSSYFSRIFKLKTNFSPSDFKNT
ncbi:helix-turn-helix domain-containing protein [Mariniflexile sp. HMF6888]|uniref:helix-turn-helix domain-containing protein n=1 Tax=Mariniflexile sp. HMF6888 TaxID=3373086 RepID=UPI00379FDCFB